MTDLVNKDVMQKVIDGKAFYEEMLEYINAVLEAELLKDEAEMDCDLIKWCTDMLVELKQENEDDFAFILPLFNDLHFAKALTAGRGFKALSRGTRAILAACITMCFAISANAAVAEIFDYNIAEEVAQAVSTRLADLGIISPKEKNKSDKEYTTELTTERVAESESKKPEAASKQEESTTAAPYYKEPEAEGSKNTTANILPGAAAGAYGNPAVEATTTTPEETTKPSKNPFENTPVVKPQTEFTIYFDCDGGECAIKSKKVTIGNTIGELPVPTKEGYNFKGWYKNNGTKKDILGRENIDWVKYDANTFLNVSQDITLVARWSKIPTAEYTVTFDANGGTCDTEKITALLNTQLTQLPVPTREGYTFDGWYNENTRVTQITFSKDITLVAHWIDNSITYTITLNPNGGSFAGLIQNMVVTITLHYGDKYGELPTPKNGSYVFAGWHTSKNTVQNPITADTVFKGDGDQTLYAVWAKKKNTLTFDANGGVCDEKERTIYQGYAVGTLPVPTRAGYTFAGWYSGNSQISPNTVFSVSSPVTVRAHWNEATYTITFDGNGGSSTTAKYTYLQTIKALPKSSRTGYELEGWYTEPEGGEKLEVGSIATMTEDTTYYAHWRKVDNPCIVVLHSNKATDTVKTLTLKYGDKFGNNVDSNIFAYLNFDGYFTDQYYGYKINEDYVVTGDMELWAHWSFMATNIEMVLTKTEYELNEEFGNDNVECIKFTGLINQELDLNEAEGYYLYADTSRYGRQTAHFRFASYLNSFGVVNMDTTADIFVVGCQHNAPSYIDDAVLPTCVSEGYSGNLYCSDCNEVLEYGESIAIVPHNDETPGHIENYAAPTCEDDGYTGDFVCDACGEVLKTGKVTDKTGHSYFEQVITKATKTADGRARLVCEYCGKENGTKTIYRIGTISVCNTYTYTGEPIKPVIIVKDIKNNVITDYTVIYDENAASVGKYTLELVFNGCYDYSVTYSYKIIPPTVTGLSCKAVHDGVLISWDASACDVDGYMLYLSYYDKKTKKYIDKDIIVTDNKYFISSADFEDTTDYWLNIASFVVDGKRIYSDFSEELMFDYEDIYKVTEPPVIDKIEELAGEDDDDEPVNQPKELDKVEEINGESD